MMANCLIHQNDNFFPNEFGPEGTPLLLQIPILLLLWGEPHLHGIRP